MITIFCPHSAGPQVLGPQQRISAHRSRAGTVTYYRCGCGNLVLDTPRGRRHSRSPLTIAC